MAYLTAYAVIGLTLTIVGLVHNYRKDVTRLNLLGVLIVFLGWPLLLVIHLFNPNPQRWEFVENDLSLDQIEFERLDQDQ